ncbi:MAG: SusD/RagB family nutrient-binding outer membrane lipoprotein [Bacteroidia bacterium]|nr:SusD/RagB family nutrient-binding outer membrane lipoprotein [Bacteroidia bacterium]
MKRFKIYLTVMLTVTLFFSGCDKDFDEINTSKTDFIALDPVFKLNKAIINLMEMGDRVQQLQNAYWLTSPFGSSLAGANYNQYTPSFHAFPFNSFMQSSVVTTTDIINQTKDDATRFNLYQAARIWKAYTFMILTDTYGDVPYTEAGAGYTDQIVRPVYDSQQAIYTDILKELDEASAALDPAKTKISGEILFAGDVAKWKKFGYSLLLRGAMRLQKADAAKAQSYVAKAVAGGLMASNADNAKLLRTPEYPNPIGTEISGNEKANYYVQKEFVEFLKTTNDPRIGSYFHRFVGALNATQQTASRRDKNPALVKGIPLGYNDVTIANTFAAEGVVSLYDYSQFDWQVVFTNTSPQWFCTYAQTQLLLAEAIVRGWATGDAAAAYSNAIKADLERMADFGTAAAVPAATVTAYVAANPLVAGDELKMIGYQYWVVSVPNGFEAWSNFRRTGYPNLTPNPYPASEIPGEFIRRHVYPDGEYVANKSNVEAAVAAQGGAANAKMNGRVWWDKP